MEPTPHTAYDEVVEDLIFEIELLLATCELVRSQERQRKAKTAHESIGSLHTARRSEVNQEDNLRFFAQRHAA